MMAASNNMPVNVGIEWAHCVKPLSSAIYNGFNKNDVPDLVNSILKSESELLAHANDEEPFYSSFAALSAHYIGANAANVTKGSMVDVIAACKILIQYFLLRLQHPVALCALSKKQLVILIKALYKGIGLLQKQDIQLLTQVVKTAKLPKHVKTRGEEKIEKNEPSGQRKESTKRVSRLDMVSCLTDQLTTPIYSQRKVRYKEEEPFKSVNSDGDTTIVHIADPSREVHSQFVDSIGVVLQQLDASNVLLDTCTNLTYLTKYMKLEPVLPATVSDAMNVRNSLQHIVSDIHVVWRVLSLPVLEPLTTKRLDKIVSVVTAGLNASLAVAASNNILTVAASAQIKGVSGAVKDDAESDQHALTIVQKSLDNYNTLAASIKNSTRAGGHNLQNFYMLGAWRLLRGLHASLSVCPSSIVERAKGKDEMKPGSPMKKDVAGSNKAGKIHQTLGVLSLALASKAITLLGYLMEDLNAECFSSKAELDLPPANASSIDGNFTAWQRIKLLMSGFNMTNFLFNLFTTSYKKAYMLKKQHKCMDDGDTASSTDSNTYYEDDFSSTDGDSSADDDEDNEPIFGQWFESTVSPHEPEKTISTVAPPSTESKSTKTQHGDSPIILPDKQEPEGYITLATDIMQFMHHHFLNTNHSAIKEYVRSSFGEPHMASLASVVRDLDRETCTGVYEDFSCAVARFNHNLIATNILTEAHQDVLLTQLGVSLMSKADWPLQIYPRTLSLLAQVLVLWQQRERDRLNSESEAAIINIWERFLEALKNGVENADNVMLENMEDVNVEHFQLLLFLFHTLPLMQKKLILLKSAVLLVELRKSPKISFEDEVHPHITRLLLLFEYLLHNFYSAPPTLIDQIQWNLFTYQTGGSTSAAVTADNDGTHCLKLHYPCKEVEESYRRSIACDVPEAAMRPHFYNIGPTDFNVQETPKIDGLASSFLLSTEEAGKAQLEAINTLLSGKESLVYSELYEACIYMLSMGTNYAARQQDAKCSAKPSLLAACFLQYHFMITWRLLACLPPSVLYMETLTKDYVPETGAEILHLLRWAPRFGNNAFSNWTKDYLVKQGITTQTAESLVQNVSKACNNVEHDINLAEIFIQKQLSQHCIDDPGKVLPVKSLPSLCNVYMLDAVIAKVQVALDESFAKTTSDPEPQKAMKIAQNLLPLSFQLIDTYRTFIRSDLLHQIQQGAGTDKPPLGEEALQAYGVVLSMASTRSGKLASYGSALMGHLPPSLRNIIDKWQGCNASSEFPVIGAWRNVYANDNIPSESYISAIVAAHVGSVSGQPLFSVAASLRHMLHSVVRLCGDLIIWCPDDSSNNELIRVMLPLVMDATTENMADFALLTLERVLDSTEGDRFLTKLYYETLRCCHQLLYCHANKESNLDEMIFHECLRFMESILDKPAGKAAMEKFYTENSDLVSVLLSTASDFLSPAYGTMVLRFFNKLFQLVEKNPADESLSKLCKSLSKLSGVDTPTLQQWLTKMIIGSSQTNDEMSSVQENRLLLQGLTSYIVGKNNHVGEDVAIAILNALIPMGSQILSPATEGMGFAELMVVMATLAGAGSGTGHVPLFKAATGWLDLCKKYLSQKDVVEKLTQSIHGGKHQIMMESACYLLSYIADILSALKQSSPERSGTASPPPEKDVPILDMDSDWAEDVIPDDDDSAAEDSDEDAICNKLCTFTVTQKEFMNQHWYHCYTCKMVDGVGVCTVCAKVCHKDHDLSYAKFGSFFCDCGAKEDGSCQALVKRTPQSILDTTVAAQTGASPFCVEPTLPSSLRRRVSSPSPLSQGPSTSTSAKQNEDSSKARQLLARQLESARDVLTEFVKTCGTSRGVLELVNSLMPAVEANCLKMSPIGSAARAQTALDELHTLDKAVESTDQLMVPTLGSQEGAFENVRQNYQGDQGQQIKQLISAHVLRRVAMCVLSSPHSKRQHLAVSHEKGKITVLQLSALLKQADSTKKKVTLTKSSSTVLQRLASAPIPFSVISISGNPCNEDFLAVCGLKECHILTFGSTGSVSDHLVMHPQLEISNYIIKSLWLPGSQTELAIITADFVKIYDLAVDALSPQYYFLLPSGKIRDCCFSFTEETRMIVIMSSAGYIYVQTMDEYSMAVHGQFYVTNVMEVAHPDLKDVGGQIAGGGVSVFYSHSLQLLFFSYTQGKTFVASINTAANSIEVKHLFPISYKSCNSNGSSGKTNTQPLCQWSEIPSHPGLMYCMTQASNSPVVLMIKPDSIIVQEIKVLPSKAKMQDMVAIRHPSSTGEPKTTLILLCEDGSLRIYMASAEQTGFWMQPTLQPQSLGTVFKPVKKKKATKTGRPAGAVSFPIDFFEHCQLLNDVEFGGNDVLQIYNVQQIKHRLNNAQLYIANTKPSGFTIEIYNSDTTLVMCGIRIQVGNISTEKAPLYMEIFGRTIQMPIVRSRWFDVPFSREEALSADKKITIFFGSSSDPSNVTMVDSIKVYGKTKEVFGWPDEPLDDFCSSSEARSTNIDRVAPDSETAMIAPVPLTSLDRLLASALEVLDGCFSSKQSSESDKDVEASINLASKLLILPTPSSVHQQTKALLASIHPNKQTYHSHKDQVLLSHIMTCLCERMTGKDIEAEAFHRLVLTARSVAVSRPMNLVKFANTGDIISETTVEVTDLEKYEDGEKTVTDTTSSDHTYTDPQHFVSQLFSVFWHLLSCKPANPFLSPFYVPGLHHVETTVSALVEILHALVSCDLDSVPDICKVYMKLLLCEDQVVSFSTKQALIKVLRPKHRRRRVFIPSPPRCSTPGPNIEEESKQMQAPSVELLQEPGESGNAFQEDDGQVLVVEGAAPEPSPLEALLASNGNFPPMLDIPGDDEAMVELAIALSLQEQQGQQNVMSQVHTGGQLSEAGHYSDTTASAGGSDDEGSTAATDGSTLRTSPAEQAGSAASSESGHSNVDSMEQNVSGRSSAYGDAAPEGTNLGMGARSETSSVCVPYSTTMMPEGQEETDLDTSFRLHTLRLLLLENLVGYLPQIREVGGVRAIPFMQVLLMLSSDLDGESESDRSALGNLLGAAIQELNMSSKEAVDFSKRSANHEVQLVTMRLLSVLMSRTKAGTKSSSESSSLISNTTATALLNAGTVDYCLIILKSLLDYWRAQEAKEETTVVAGCLLKAHPTLPPPDMSPFFLRQYVKGHASDVFEAYPQLLTEMVLRLPYQMKKIADAAPSVVTPVFDQAWFYYLCEYMMTSQTPFVRRQVRKLLLFICGSKDKYRQLRDLHALESHMKNIKVICAQSGFSFESSSVSEPITLAYDSLIALIEHLKACCDIATTRTTNWQKFCQKDESILSFLIQVSFLLNEGVSPNLLQLLQCALCGSKMAAVSSSSSSGNGSPFKHKKDRTEKEKSEDTDEAQKYDEALCISLVQQVNKFVDTAMMSQFLRSFLLESNSTSVRWQAHALLLHIYRNSTLTQQGHLLSLMWTIWPELPLYGHKAAQFVDLLGYFALKTPHSEKKAKEFVESAVYLLRTQNQLLANHPNANIYDMLSGLVEFDGYYLESDPCLVCSNPEVPFSSIKLSAIKVDSRFTTTTQIVKLVGSHVISKVTLRVADLKRTKMVRTVNFYYNNRAVQSVVELKNKPQMWHRAKKCTLAAGQTELKVEFPLPIVACNLMIEYADFYENFQASAETLQCPRCSASVPSSPGVCNNCGENVFQCHKCRAINYDEKDPFLCNACGFCKYAKFDYSLTAKPCCAVDPIENEEDRKKASTSVNVTPDTPLSVWKIVSSLLQPGHTKDFKNGTCFCPAWLRQAVTSINSLLEKADRVYKQLVSYRPTLDALLQRVNEHGGEKMQDDGTNPTSNVNRAIQLLAQKYCGECKTNFDELSKIIQKVLATRKELIEYDRQNLDQNISSAHRATDIRVQSSPSCDEKRYSVLSSGRCYGCASAAMEHCLTLLRALAINTKTRNILCNQGLIKNLIDYNLRRGTQQSRSDVRQLLCLLTKDNSKTTDELNAILMGRITAAFKSHHNMPDLSASVRHEIQLLSVSVQKEDSCWEQRVRCVLNLFLMCMNSRSPVVMENITLPCLKILNHIIKPETPSSKKNKEKSVESLASIKTVSGDVRIDVKKWLANDSQHSYNTWRATAPPVGTVVKDSRSQVAAPAQAASDKSETRSQYLIEKYGQRWLDKTLKRPSQGYMSLKLMDSAWLRHVLFSLSSRSARQVACNMLEAMCQVPSRKRELLDLLTSYLDELGKSGESAAEFLGLYQRLMKTSHWKNYLAIRGVLPHIGNLITKEIEHLCMLEESTLSSDLSQGFALKALTELLASFVEQETIKQQFKSKLVGVVLNGYLSLRKLIVQRTKLIDETQDKLLELLEEMTSGTESETRAFMAVCVETLEKYPYDDIRTPAYIFERLCSMIFPEENDVSEFFITLEKDPQQEDFLQGRMLGNPYSSNEPGLGPLMRDVKNKICQDCELVALLEDDSGMELLVNNKIISLDLPVKEVYKKVWSPVDEGEAMRIVYRMRGLLGDATEEFIESLDTKKDEEVDNESVYKMASVLSECGGLEAMLKRLAAIGDFNRGRPLVVVLLKLFGFCIKLKVNRQKLIDPQLGAINTMLGSLNKVLLCEQAENVAIAEKLLQVQETVLVEASAQPAEVYREFTEHCLDKNQLNLLLDRINSSFVRQNSAVLQGLMRLIPFLTFRDDAKMSTLISHFQPYCDFNKFDMEHTQDEIVHLDCFCVICSSIECNPNGYHLKDMIMSAGIVQSAVNYIQLHSAPSQHQSVVVPDSQEWKEFIAKPALPYVLRLLTGLSRGHAPTQLMTAECLPVIHKLEQVSSEEHIGSLAENLMESLKGNPDVANKIKDVRQQTKAEKKRLAMAMRQKQLGALGMKTNEKGQVTAQSSVLKQMEDLGEEMGLTCCICREGYKFHPNKVLGIYTYTKRCNVEEAEPKVRKTIGYSTVSHFNIVHVDCHMAAVRLARGREEWESAALQNANTRCNGLLPIWGPNVAESLFANCLARHNTYLQESTGHRDITYQSTIHDIKLLLLRFSSERSFSEDTGGGGKESNMKLLPYMLHVSLYVINTTRATAREEKNINTFLEKPKEAWIESAYEAEGIYFWATMALHIWPHETWRQRRIDILKRLLITTQLRHTSPGGATRLLDRAIKSFSVYKPCLLFFGLLDQLYSIMFKKVSWTKESEWSACLADFIRNSDSGLLETSEKVLNAFQTDLIPVESFTEFCDVLGMLGDISDTFMADLFASLPQ